MVALLATSMVAVSFLIPLALLLRTQVHAEATAAAQQRAAVAVAALAQSSQPADLAPVVARLDSSDRLCLHLPDGQVVGTPHASAQLLGQAVQDRESVSRDVAGGWEYLQPVFLNLDRVAVVEEFVPRAELTRGVTRAWAVMSLLALGLVIGSVLVADRLGARAARASRRLAHASAALGAGNLDVRVEPAGPTDLYEAGLAFNSMADHVKQLLATERELVADLSHRLRTPLTALHLAVEQIGPVQGRNGQPRRFTISRPSWTRSSWPPGHRCPPDRRARAARSGVGRAAPAPSSPLPRHARWPSWPDTASASGRCSPSSRAARAPSR